MMRFSHELDPRQSVQLIDRAGRDSAQVLLELCGDNASYCGQVVSADESVLLVELSRAGLDRAALTGRYVDVQLFTDHRYFFTTTITAAVDPLHPRKIALRRPDRVQQFQRRRYLRARLTPTTTVRLQLGTEHGGRLIEAALLNVSSDGLACRLSSASATPLRAGQSLGAAFELPGSGVPYAFPASVRNKTPGLDGTDLIGLQFVIAPHDSTAQAAMHALRKDIYQQQSIAHPQEVLA